MVELVYILHSLSLLFVCAHTTFPLDIMKWAVKLSCEHQCNYSFDDLASRLAAQVGATNRGQQIGALHKHFLFTFSSPKSRRKLKHLKRFIQAEFTSNLAVEWHEEQVVRIRNKRDVEIILDPLYPSQWHLHNHRLNGLDMNVTSVWQHNITGDGVTVCIVDDGIEWTHPDLQGNYNPNGSWDLNDNDADPMPLTQDGNEHGTRCAGEIAAAVNNVCGVGVAYGAKISGVKILAGNITDDIEAVGFIKNLDVNDIFSCSWGPLDNGEALDGPHTLTQQALLYGVEFGRRGFGAIYVVASGNGRHFKDNCNYDGYANSIYTITIGAVDELGNVPYYSEECAASLAVTFSGGSFGKRAIVTTERRLSNGSSCTFKHSGTSAAAPLAAGVIALMLQANPCLSWRDVQYLIILTSTKINPYHVDWFTNSANLSHNHYLAFGLVNTWLLVNAAIIWLSVPQLTTYTSEIIHVNSEIPHTHVLTVSHYISETMLSPYQLHILEWVQIGVTIEHPCRGRLELRIQCPSGTTSVIGSSRPKDKSKFGFQDWIFTTVRCWGEKPNGTWNIIIKDT
uniref:P/Homo B domain-containing protein n=1 Tax=Strigamia maritima TaxID=126957 RepID=T1ITJ2_STRMM